MEPELERNRPTTPRKPSTAPSRSEKTKAPPYEPIRTPVEFERRTYAREVCVVMGFILLSIGLIGMVVDNLLTLHLSYTHNLIHIISGALAIWFGVRTEVSAKRFAYSFGAIYGLLGLLGFAVGVHGTATVGHIAEDNFLWVISPEKLELGSLDHVIHLAIGIVFLASGLIMFKRRRSVLSKE